MDSLAVATNSHRLPLSTNAPSYVCIFVLLLSLPSATLSLRLEYTYPTPGDYNDVQLSCVETFGAVSSATFHVSRGGSEQQIDGDAGMIRYALSPANEGLFLCKSGGDTSDSVPLAAQPVESYDCSTDDPDTVDYQMREFSPHDLYIFNCSIRPGALVSSYSIEWRSRRGTNRSITHNDIDTETFAVSLRSSYLRMLYREEKILECRVDIQHAPNHMNTYCGQRIRAAVKANITQPLPPTTQISHNTPFNLSCSATGNELEFTWKFGDNTYDSSDECSDNSDICVNEITSPESPLKRTSILKVRGDSVVAGSQTEVQCSVSQNLVPRFRAQTLTTSGTVSVGPAPVNNGENEENDDDNEDGVDGEDGESEIDRETATLSPPTSSSSESPSTNDVATTSSPLLNDLHITLIIIVPPAAVIAIVAIFLLYCYMNRRKCRERCSNGHTTKDGTSSRESTSPSNHALLSMNSDESDGNFVDSPPQLLPGFLQLFHNAASRFLTLILPASFASWVTTNYPRHTSLPLRSMFNNRATNQLFHVVRHRVRQVRSKHCHRDETCTLYNTVHELIVKNRRTGEVKKICWNQPAQRSLTPSPPHSVSTTTTPLPSSPDDCATPSLPTGGEHTAIPMETTPPTKGQPDYAMSATNPVFDEVDGHHCKPLETTEDNCEPLETTEDNCEPLETTLRPLEHQTHEETDDVHLPHISNNNHSIDYFF